MPTSLPRVPGEPAVDVPHHGAEDTVTGWRATATGPPPPASAMTPVRPARARTASRSGVLGRPSSRLEVVAVGRQFAVGDRLVERGDETGGARVQADVLQGRGQLGGGHVLVDDGGAGHLGDGLGRELGEGERRSPPSS